MQGAQTGFLRGSITRVRPGVLALAVLLSVPGGCATGPREAAPLAREPAPAVEQEPPPVPAVVRFEGSREGFAITEIPPADEALYRDFDRAVALLKDENHDQAIVLLEKITARSPGVTAPYINLAIAYRRAGSFEQAEENLKKALDLFPGHPLACNEYGLLYRRTGRFAEARAMYEMAVARFPEFTPAHRNLGILCDLYLDDLACAVEHYEIYSEARPYDERVQLWLADLRTRLGRDQGGK